jgi:hypothetical protein
VDWGGTGVLDPDQVGVVGIDEGGDARTTPSAT